MDILKMAQQVFEFQNTFKVFQSIKPTELSKEQRILRFDLQKEELEELKKAIKQDDNLETLDAIVDSIYVCLGSFLQHGLVDFYLFYRTDRKVEEIDYIFFQYSARYINNRLTIDEIHTYYLNILTYFINLYKKYEDKGVFKKDSLMNAFTEVHNSNMSKLDKNGKPIFREDGKILKREGYFSPNLKPFLR